MSAADEARNAYLKFFEGAWHGDNPGDTVDALMVPDFVDNTPVPGQIPGREGNKWWVRTVRAGFPGIRGAADPIISDGDLVGFVITQRGTHTGEFLGIPPTGKQIAIQGIDIMRYRDGRFTEGWATFDIMSVMAQLGVGPPGAGGPPGGGPPGASGPPGGPPG
jgi:predicted ester cyclase